MGVEASLWAPNERDSRRSAVKLPLRNALFSAAVDAMLLFRLLALLLLLLLLPLAVVAISSTIVSVTMTGLAAIKSGSRDLHGSISECKKGQYTGIKT